MLLLAARAARPAGWELVTMTSTHALELKGHRCANDKQDGKNGPAAAHLSFPNAVN